MKKVILVSLAAIVLGCANHSESSSVRSLVLDQLRYSHNKANWYAPMSAAVSGLTAKQANWKDSTANHSIGQLGLQRQQRRDIHQV